MGLTILYSIHKERRKSKRQAPLFPALSIPLA
jgi:hypothetical protein